MFTILRVLLCVVFVVSFSIMLKLVKGDYDQVTYQGQFQSKYMQEYACGKHDRRTCEGYYVETLDSVIKVDRDFYEQCNYIQPVIIVEPKPPVDPSVLFIFMLFSVVGLAFTGLSEPTKPKG